MNSKTCFLIALATGSILTSSLAQAGPPVHITVKNLGSQEIYLQPGGSNGATTKAYAFPAPAASIKPMGQNSFSVANSSFPDVTSAFLRYTAGNKACEFKTSYIKTVAPGGLFSGKLNSTPKWDKKATGSGGATCTVTVTSASFSDHS